MSSGGNYSPTSSLNLQSLVKLIDESTKTAQDKISALQNESESVSIGDMFEMQILMNSLSQLSEMSTAIVSASNAAIKSMATNIRG